MDDEGLSPVPREARPYQGRHAGLVSRVVAAVIDLVVVVLALFLGYGALAGALFVIDPTGFGFPAPGLVLSVTSGLVVLVLYLAFSWWTNGRTYGCLVMGLRVQTRSGGRIGLPVSLLRALFCAFFPVGLVWIVIGAGNRSVQDLVMRTEVVYDWQPRGPRRGEPGGQAARG